jgi:anthranilate phosphoribosyltransferase
MDEISISGETLVGELIDGQIREYRVHPADFGLQSHDGRALRVANQQESLAFIRRALSNEVGPVRDIVLLNAGAALYCAGVAASMGEGIERAREAVATGAALQKLAQFAAFTQAFKAAQA